MCLGLLLCAPCGSKLGEENTETAQKHNIRRSFRASLLQLNITNKLCTLTVPFSILYRQLFYLCALLQRLIIQVPYAILIRTVYNKHALHIQRKPNVITLTTGLRHL